MDHLLEFPYHDIKVAREIRIETTGIRKGLSYDSFLLLRIRVGNATSSSIAVHGTLVPKVCLNR